MRKSQTADYGVFDDAGLHGRYSSLKSAQERADELEAADRDADYHVRKLIRVGKQHCWTMFF